MKSKSVYVAILNQGWIRPELATLLSRLPEQRKYNLYIGYPAHKPITNNRNIIVKRFLESGMDYLLMIDNDNVPPENILDLADYEKDIVSGLCFAFMKNMIIPLCLKMNQEKTYDLMDIEEKSGLVECDGVGSGVMMIKREVLEKLPFPFRNEYDPEGIKTKGLDVNFCRRAKEIGFKVWCHLDMKCSHWTPVDIRNVWIGYNELIKEINKIKKYKDMDNEEKSIHKAKKVNK